MLLILSIIFAIVHSPSGDYAASFQGQGQDQVSVGQALTGQGYTFDFVDQATYDAFIVSHQTVQPTPAQRLATERSDAVSELNVGTQPLTKLERAVFLVTLDEINLIRGLLVPAQSPRTVAQFKNAVQNKINSGAAD